MLRWYCLQCIQVPLHVFGAVPETCLPYTLSGYSRKDRAYKRQNPLQCPRSCANPSNLFSPISNRLPGFIELRSEAEVTTALDQRRPVYAVMEVRKAFRAYRCGVFVDAPVVKPNHALEIVDYSGSDPNYRGTPYWVVKNSWGNTWGEDGYIRVARGRNQLTAFVTVSESTQTSLPASTPSLATPTCSAQEPDDDSDNELVEKAARFAVEELNRRSEIRCAEDNSLVATLSFSGVINGTIQVIEGFSVQVMVEMNVGNCPENYTANVTFGVTMDLNQNLVLVEYHGYVVNSAKASGGRAVIAVFAIVAVSAIFPGYLDQY